MVSQYYFPTDSPAASLIIATSCIFSGGKSFWIVFHTSGISTPKVVLQHYRLPYNHCFTMASCHGRRFDFFPALPRIPSQFPPLFTTPFNGGQAESMRSLLPHRPLEAGQGYQQ